MTHPIIRFWSRHTVTILYSGAVTVAAVMTAIIEAVS